MNKYKHSGALGDLIYAMIVAKNTGGGEFYLHLNQLDWIGKHYYGAEPAPFHKGRMTKNDFDYMQTFMEAQDYVSKFDLLDPKTTEISHNLDRFRPLFVGHPTNYLNIYAEVFKLSGPCIDTEPWLSVPNPRKIEGKSIVINRTPRWVTNEPNPQWALWRNEGYEEQAIFVGLPEEHKLFCDSTGWNIPWHATAKMLDLAEVIAGAEIFIGNQSQCYALAVGLGLPKIYCEVRRDLPIERNECYFPNRKNVEYF